MTVSLSILHDIRWHEVKQLALSAASELIDQHEVFLACDSDHALYLTRYGSIVSLLVWREWKEEECAWIGMGWTRPDCRRLGLYRQLYNAFLPLAREQGFKIVRAGISAQNDVSIEVHERLGLKPCMLEVRL